MPERPHLAPDAVTGFVATELAESAVLFHQRGYLARVLAADGSGGLRDDGIQPLAHVLDGGGPDVLAATLEADGSGAIYPVLYTRIGGKVVEQAIETDPLMRFDTTDARRMIGEMAARITRASGPVPSAGPALAPPSGADREPGQALRGGHQRLGALREREPELRAAELGSREERRARDGRDARVADDPQRERDVVLAGSARSPMSVMT